MDEREDLHKLCRKVRVHGGLQLPCIEFFQKIVDHADRFLHAGLVRAAAGGGAAGGVRLRSGG